MSSPDGADLQGGCISGARALLAWDGTAYGGWQIQPHVETVQGVVEGALARIMNTERVVVRAAGRLDAGVHAQAQVVGFGVPARRSAETLFRGLNGLLPPDIACLALSPEVPDFDPRRSSRGKVYRYRYLTRGSRCPFRRFRCWQLGRRLDVAAMQRGARLLEGEHDYSSFRASGCSSRHPVRRIRSVQVTAHLDEVHLVVDGEAFLRHQVRIIAGCLAEVGLGRQPPEWMGQLLASRDRALAARTAPAHGLSLERVHFAPTLQWAVGGEPVALWDVALVR